MSVEEIQQKLGPILTREMAAMRVTVQPGSVRRLTGGAVHETWSVDVTVERDGRPLELHELVLRAFTQTGANAVTARQEFDILSTVHAAGVPAPRPIALLEEGLSAPCFLVERVAGETIGRRLVMQPVYSGTRRVIAAQLGAAAASIHRIPLTAALREHLRAPAVGESAAAFELGRSEETYRSATRDPHPAFELAFRWLSRRLPEPVGSVFVHGDYRVGNIVFGPEGLRYVLDWEGAHMGDPAEDLGWACVRSWRFGGKFPVGGVGTRKDLFDGYEAAGGGTVDPERVRWWEIFGNLRWGVITITMVAPFLRGDTHDVELAAIGRRTTETEGELMALLGDIE